jgi:hypothetical protein
MTIEQTVEFLNKEIKFREILLSTDDKGDKYAWIDNGGGSDNDFIELSVEHLVDIVESAYQKGIFDGCRISL